jgi:hypothetical protein
VWQQKRGLNGNVVRKGIGQTARCDRVTQADRRAKSKGELLGVVMQTCGSFKVSALTLREAFSCLQGAFHPPAPRHHRRPLVERTSPKAFLSSDLVSMPGSFCGLIEAGSLCILRWGTFPRRSALASSGTKYPLGY